jgi:outer membrane protein OmpA-like peptidoglycan-associated protein
MTMSKLAAVFATGVFFAAAPAFAQSVGNCPTAGNSPQSQPVWVMFDLGSAVLHDAEKPKIAQAVATAKARQVIVVCVVGNTDKLGDKAMNAKLALARSQAVAAQMVRDGLPGKNIVIAANPEAFGNESLGSADAQVKDRRVTIVFTR